MTLKHLDEAYIQLAMNDHPDLPEEFVREVVKARQEPLLDYNFGWIRDQFEEDKHDKKEN